MNITAALTSRIRWVLQARTAASAVLYSLFSRLSILLINLTTAVIVSRTLGPAGRGSSGAIALLPLLLSGLLTLGVPAALRYEVRRRVARASEIFSSALIVSVVLGIIAAGAGFAIAPHFLAQYPTEIIAFAQLMMVFVPLMLMNATLQAFYESRGDFRRSNSMINVPPALTLTTLIVLYFVHRLSPYSAALAYECPFGLMTLVTVFRLRDFLRWPRKAVERLKSLLHYGVRAYGIDILSTLAGQIDQAMVVRLLSAQSFGLYVVAISGSRILAVLGMSLNTVLFPTAAALDGERAVALVSKSARLIFSCTLVAALCFVVTLPVVVPIVFGKEYLAVIDLTRILVIGVVFGATTSTLTQAFMATGRPEIATILQGAGVCITVPLMFTLIPHFGIRGAAYAIVISNAIRFVFVMIAFPLFLHYRIPRVLPTREDVDEIVARLRRHAPAA